MMRRAVSCLLVLCGVCATSLAFADAKQCVAQNNDGAQKRDEHHLLAARDAYRACVAETECPEVVRAECDSALADLKTAIPTLLVAVLDEHQHDLAGATLTLDGQPVPLDGSTVEVDPGTHELAASSGELSSKLEVKAIESDLNRRVEIVLQAPHVDEPVGDTSAGPAEPVRHRSKVPAYALGGVAAVGAASFAYFAISGHSKLTGTLDVCKPYCQADDVQSVRTKYLIADISLGVSLVALASAGYWLLSAPKEAPRASNVPLSVAVTAQPGAAGLSVRWVE
jgi:hypothetical protein